MCNIEAMNPLIVNSETFLAKLFCSVLKNQSEVNIANRYQHSKNWQWD
jgi:hypothetical protein